MSRLVLTNQGCSVPWCVSLHCPGDDLGHFGEGVEFPVMRDTQGRGYLEDAIKEEIDVSLDQIGPGGEVYVCLSAVHGHVWMTREQAKRLAMHLIKLDLLADAAK